MRVLIADDDRQVRSALRLLLEQVPGIQVVGEVREAKSLGTALAASAPDIVLLDWELSGLDPRRHLGVFGGTERPRIIVLSSRPEARAAAMRAAADAFVSKGDPPEALLAALSKLSRTSAAASSSRPRGPAQSPRS